MIAPMTGTAQSLMAHMPSRATCCRVGDQGRGHPIGIAQLAVHRSEVDPGHKGTLARGSEDGDRDVTTIVEAAEGVADLGHRGAGDSVDRGTVEGHGGHVILDADGHIGHLRPPWPRLPTPMVPRERSDRHIRSGRPVVTHCIRRGYLARPRRPRFTGLPLRREGTPGPIGSILYDPAVPWCGPGTGTGGAL